MREYCASFEPNLREEWREGCWFQKRVLYPPCAARFLFERAQKRGAELFLGSSVVPMGEGRIGCEDGSEIRAERIVNAAGARAAQLTSGVEIKTAERTSGHH